MANRYNRIYCNKPQSLKSLDQQAREIFHHLHAEEVEEDGTIALMRDGEPPHLAIIRAADVHDERSKRRWRREVPKLLAGGFLVVEDDRVKLANWEARSEWGNRAKPGEPSKKKGPVPPPCVGPDGDPTTTRQRPDDDPTATRPRHPNTPNATESHGAAQRNGSGLLGSARIGTEVGGVSNEGSPGDGPPGSDGAEVRDIATGEVIDPADFYDPPPEERERLAAELPPDAVTPDVTVEAAALFDDVAEEPF